jgi:uncharacterized membrane protein YgdD (TMEM256/DUF423 family)
VLAAGVLGAAGVALGAFGAHGLKTQLGPEGLETWRTAVSYHLIHVLALFGCGLWLRFLPEAGTAVVVAAFGFIAGILLFSGSLYVLALGGPRWLGPVTPLGGVAFIAGWLALVPAALKSTTL